MEKHDMPAKGRSKNLAASFCAMFLLLVVAINYFILSNEAVRNEMIEFLLPLLERFLHQPEMDISSIGKNMHS